MIVSMVIVMDFVSMFTESHGILVDTVALWLVHWAPDRVVWVLSTDQGHSVVFLDKTLYSHSTCTSE